MGANVDLPLISTKALTMDQLEEDLSFNCPYCGANNVSRVDFTGGKKQKFVVDCENCCHPILIKVQIDEDGIQDFTIEKE